MLIVVFFSVAVSATSQTTLAETYHVAREAFRASDSNDGLSPVYDSGNHGPWLTLTHAAEIVRAGDTILVHGGDYREEVTGWGIGVISLQNSGIRFAPIRYVAVPGQQVVINELIVRDRQWIQIDGFTFTGREFVLPENWQDMPAIVVDDPNVVIDPGEDWSTREADVRRKYATYMGMLDFLTTDHPSGLDVKNCNNIEIRDCTFKLYAFGIQVRGISSEILIERNSFTHCLDAVFTWQPAPAMSNSIVRENTVRQCFNDGMQIRENSDQVLVQRNDVQYCGTSHISLLSGCTNCTLRGNSGLYGGFYSETMRNPGSTAINVNGCNTGNIVEQNFAAYQIDLTTYDGNGFFADLMRDGAGVLFRNNIAYRNMGSGLRTYLSPNCVIVNNTFVANGFNNADLYSGAGLRLANEIDVNQTIVNNIFFNNRLAGIRSFDSMDRQRWIDHNLYFALNGTPFIWDGYDFDERAYYTLAEIRQNTTWEQNGQEGNPLFRNINALDFRLMLLSPAIDTGQSLPFLLNPALTNNIPAPVVVDDFDGMQRPRGAHYDIGAFESY